MKTKERGDIRCFALRTHSFDLHLEAPDSHVRLVRRSRAALEETVLFAKHLDGRMRFVQGAQLGRRARTPPLGDAYVPLGA
jgi:hypothetical protein